ncbi:MAG: hypothetical protein IPM42_01610 [Saprospiraceae bacterium]|nr:hypothetical protein [Saprospiraceae bacterium]
MTEQLNNLPESNYDKLKDAIILITVLIAGADGKIEVEELEWAEKVTHIRGYKMEEELKDFYNEVSVGFAQKIKDYIRDLPQNVEERSQILSEKLAEINPILAKLDSELGATFYKSYVSFAKHVAKSSGGILGFFSIAKEEAKWIGLPMIHPIVFEGHNDEEE